jgi:DNA sulfur modification protein DndE
MIDRIRISPAGKNQLIQLKRKTGIEQYNIICRFALMLSLCESSRPPEETMKSGGIEIDWKVFCGNETDLYENLLIQRCLKDGEEVNESNLKRLLSLHVHRGLAYLNSKPEKINLVQ